jgi:hypothetical protein
MKRVSASRRERLHRKNFLFQFLSTICRPLKSESSPPSCYTPSQRHPYCMHRNFASQHSARFCVTRRVAAPATRRCSAPHHSSPFRFCITPQISFASPFSTASPQLPSPQSLTTASKLPPLLRFCVTHRQKFASQNPTPPRAPFPQPRPPKFCLTPQNHFASPFSTDSSQTKPPQPLTTLSKLPPPPEFCVTTQLDPPSRGVIPFPQTHSIIQP